MHLYWLIMLLLSPLAMAADALPMERSSAPRESLSPAERYERRDSQVVPPTRGGVPYQNIDPRLPELNRRQDSLSNPMEHQWHEKDRR